MSLVVTLSGPSGTLFGPLLQHGIAACSVKKKQTKQRKGLLQNNPETMEERCL